MDLVDEKHAAFRVEHAFFFGALNLVPNVLNATRNRAHGRKWAVHMRSQELRQGGLSHAWRSPKQQRGQALLIQSGLKRSLRAYDVALAHIAL